MSNQILKNKRGIIFGALNEDSIAWKVAEKTVEEGASIILTNTSIALRAGEINKLSEKTNAKIIPADATSVEDLERLFEEAQNHLKGKIDFVLHSIGMSPNIRKKRAYYDLDYNFMNKTIDISALSFHKMLQVAYKQDAIAPNGSILALTYIAAQRTYDSYSDMANAKALLESICRSFGMIYGEKNGVRINTISQSPTKTTAGKGIDGFDLFYDFAEKMSPLGNASAEECADYCIMMFSDYTRKVTMQNLFHDGGYSSTGMTQKLLNQYQENIK